MKIFVVIWTLVSIVPQPCPNNVPDAYGRMPQHNCLVLHVKTVKEIKKKVFATRGEAEKFILDAMQPPGFDFNSFQRVEDFRIEERDK